MLLGNLDATRDWGHAQDYVRAMVMILQHDEPDDFVCATGVSHTVRELVQYVFGKLDLDWEKYVGIDQRYWRPDELVHLKGDPTKVKKVLGLELVYSFETMLDEMIAYWLESGRLK
jgi:GDPmannose 4,6-dehydratase